MVHEMQIKILINNIIIIYLIINNQRYSIIYKDK